MADEDDGNGIYLDQGSNDNKIMNNTVINNTRSGIYFRYDIYDCYIYNNTINLSEYGINLGYVEPSVSTPICNNTFEENWIYNTTYGN